jgi:hypothetical protein
MSDRTILSPQNANALNTIFGGSGTSELSCSELVINSGNTLPVLLNSNTGNNLIITTGANQGLQFSTGVAGGTITCTGNNQLTTNSTMIIPQILFKDPLGAANTVYLQESSTNNLLLTSGANTGIQFSTGVGSGSITCTGANALTCAGNFSATTYGGGIGNLFAQYGFSALAGGTANGVSFAIPNFVGSDTTSYVISGNGTTVDSPPNVLYPLIWNVSWLSTVGTTTNVLVTITNVGSATITGVINFSVIAMN